LNRHIHQNFLFQDCCGRNSQRGTLGSGSISLEKTNPADWRSSSSVSLIYSGKTKPSPPQRTQRAQRKSKRKNKGNPLYIPKRFCFCPSFAPVASFAVDAGFCNAGNLVSQKLTARSSLLRYRRYLNRLILCEGHLHRLSILVNSTMRLPYSPGPIAISVPSASPDCNSFMPSFT